MKRNRSRRRLKTTVTVNIACEGISERVYIENLLKEYGLFTPNITVSNLEGKGMLPTISYFENNEKLYKIFIFIIDLDRAKQKEIELRNLNKLIDKVEKSNIKNNLFLSNPNFEVFVAASIGIDYEKLYLNDYQKGNGVYKFIKSNSGDYEKAISNLPDKYYYDKKDLDKKGNKKVENLEVNHSNLVYFIDYMKRLLEKK